jgi:hypothetical protein
MPRARKTLTGAPARPNVPIAGQTYGAGVDQQQLEASMPTPARQAAAPNPQPQPQPQQQQAPQQQPYDHQAALAAASQLSDQTGLLKGDTNRPNEPITAGLTRGPGPGPEALGMTRGSPTGDLFRRLSAATGDPFFADLAAKAQQ